MKATLVVLFAAGSMAFAADPKTSSIKIIDEAASVFTEINQAPDKGIPHDVLERAQCIGIIPGLKRAGFIVGGKYGKGVVVCRTSTHGGWSAPAIERVEGGSVGFQIGAGETDLVFAIMGQRGMSKLMEDKFTIGGDASAMAGPVGRTAEAQTDAMMHAEILSWSRARGLFAGVSLDGSTLRPDKDDNQALYGREATPREILMGSVTPPPSAQPLYAALKQYKGARTAHR
jgi:lipid-binding SYLF domain-containing protein